MDFVDLWRTLDLLNGEPTLLGIAYARQQGARLLGCTRGELHVFTQAELDAEREQMDNPPPVAAAPGERAHYFRVGAFELTISSGYEGRVLSLHAGPMLLTLDFREADHV